MKELRYISTAPQPLLHHFTTTSRFIVIWMKLTGISNTVVVVQVAEEELLWS